ncbi:hypothetical protein WN48_07980 [Eufriesea mexicana]|uniref:Uncharacterized protein n=1 Tax=Eufriesea mexicana TaxID=516756 RepID=A0A310SNY9_9HYME|nr:hypothetical protein WN48_07980 [Eufriesea mexicana]
MNSYILHGSRDTTAGAQFMRLGNEDLLDIGIPLVSLTENHFSYCREEKIAVDNGSRCNYSHNYGNDPRKRGEAARMNRSRNSLLSAAENLISSDARSSLRLREEISQGFFEISSAYGALVESSIETNKRGAINTLNAMPVPRR